MTDDRGALVADRYELLEVLGQGSQAEVWRALDRRSGALVAVKMLTGPATLDKKFQKRLQREMGVMKALEGTCAVAAFDLCTSRRGAPCLVMELLEGTDFEEHLRERAAVGNAMGLAELMELLSPVVAALERAHAVGVVHRDLKPANVFLQDGPSGTRVRLLDFGLARVRTAQPLTAVGTVIGSPAYMAPEVWKGIPERIDARADVYSLAVLVYRALAGVVPFDAPTLPAQFTLVTTAERPSLRRLRSDLPQAIDAWVARGLAVEPEERFADVRVLWDALGLTAKARRGLGFGFPKIPKPLRKAWKAAVNRLSGGASRESQGAAAAGSPRTPIPHSEPGTPVEAVAEPDAADAGALALPRVPPPPRPRAGEDDAKTLVRLPRVDPAGADRVIPPLIVTGADASSGDTRKGPSASRAPADAKTRLDLPRVTASGAVTTTSSEESGPPGTDARKVGSPSAKKAGAKKTGSPSTKRAGAKKTGSPSTKKAAKKSESPSTKRAGAKKASVKKAGTRSAKGAKKSGSGGTKNPAGKKADGRAPRKTGGAVAKKTPRS